MDLPPVKGTDVERYPEHNLVIFCQARFDRWLDKKGASTFRYVGCLPSYMTAIWGFSDVATDVYLSVNNLLGGSVFTDSLFVLNTVFQVGIGLKELGR